MFARFGHVLVIVALLVTTGGHWALLQTLAWTNMLAANLQTDSFPEALTKTFDGDHPCSLCKEIASGKQTEKKSDFPAQAKKIEFTHGSCRFVFAPPLNFWLQNEFATRLDPRTHTPPLPPPRPQLC